MSNLSYQERDVLKTILAFYGATDEKLQEHLEEFADWHHDNERAKSNRSVHPQFPLVFLSLRGIYGRGARS